MQALILVKLDFNRPFIVDVDWSVKGVGAILSQNLGNRNKSLLMQVKVYFQYNVVFTPWKGSVMLLSKAP